VQKMVTQPSVLTDDTNAPLAESSTRRVPNAPRQIPWGYGRDRVTAIAIDPEQLFVYWEILDESIESARAQLGPSGARATLALRVYDTSGRIFDGGNAHTFFDQDVQRNDRQWFCNVGRPSSSAHVEMGLRTHDGRFLKITRSGRVDFPRGDPAPARPSEWMRVVASTGDIVARETASPRAGHHGAGPHESAEHMIHGGPIAAAGGGESPTGSPSFDRIELDSYELKELELERYETDTGWQTDPMDASAVYRMVTTSWEEFGFGTTTWESGPSESSWEAGPFNYPTEIIVPAAERFEGVTQVYRSGEQVRVLHGPWQVLIRGIQAHSSRRVLARWEVHRTWVSITSRNGESISHGAVQGRSTLGASERYALSASELRLRGASEIFFLGASERRLGGASETRFLAASQWIARGASERRFMGASEWRLMGASERRLMGASERRLMGASERHFMGASERRSRGASEQRLSGSSEQRLSGHNEQRPSAYPRSVPRED
jgi:hypothetical protein